MRLVDDDGELLVLCEIPALRDDVRELLYGRDDDPLAVLDGRLEVARMLRPREHALHLHELLDGVAYLLVEDAPVRDDDDGIEHRLAAAVLHLREQMHKPRNRIGLPAPG